MARDIEPLRQFFRDCRDAATFQDLSTAADSLLSNSMHVVMASYIHYPPVGARDFDGQIQVGPVWLSGRLAENLSR
jgi:hypothetical protein